MSLWWYSLQAISETADHFVDERACAEFRGVVKAEAPNGFFSKFSGTIRMEPNGEGHPLSADQILLRGCVLRNVDYVYAMVVYTGDQTKIRVKQTEKVFKKASVESTINYNILLLVAMLVVICVSGTILFVVWSADHEDDWYLRLDGRPGFLKVRLRCVCWLEPCSRPSHPRPSASQIIEKVFTFFLLNNAFIPVSLYVTMKMARQCQKWFMEWDVRMYHEDKEQVKLTDGKEGHYPMRVRSMDLNDELGQISHVFSDKTGASQHLQHWAGCHTVAALTSPLPCRRHLHPQLHGVQEDVRQRGFIRSGHHPDRTRSPQAGG